MSVAFITGITGQDGYYLSKLLLEKDYSSWTVRRSSSINASRIDDLISGIESLGIKSSHSDLLDSASLNNLITASNRMKFTI